MLTSLQIENIAVIEKAEISFNKGLNVLTGETGAGKSIIIDSINAVLGERTTRELVRSGAPSAKVSALFFEISRPAMQVLESCMDDDDMRRGKPSSHVKFGEANALLAGDALLTLAFETMLDQRSGYPVDPKRTIQAAAVLAHAAGGQGMIGGQVIDLASEGRQIPLDRLKVMDSLKTGALIDAAAQMGCVVAGAGETICKAASLYSSCIGLAFQIVDDILDMTSSTDVLGKPVGSDREKEKSTYVSLLGLDASRRLVTELTATARETLSIFEERASFLLELTERLATREK